MWILLGLYSGYITIYVSRHNADEFNVFKSTYHNVTIDRRKLKVDKKTIEILQKKNYLSYIPKPSYPVRITDNGIGVVKFKIKSFRIEG